MRRHFHSHRHYHPRRELFKGEEASSKAGKVHRKVCPNCGCDKFHSVWFWPFQRNRCEGGHRTFGKPFTEIEHQKAREFERTRR